MILGNPYNFSVFISTIKEWNVDNEFFNGVLLFSINGNIFPEKIVTATLKCEVRLLKEKLKNLVTNEGINIIIGIHSIQGNRPIWRFLIREDIIWEKQILCLE